MKKVLGLLFLVLAVSAFAVADPVEQVRQNDAALQKMLKKGKRTDKETEQIKKLINGIFDFSLLARKSLPSATWKSLLPEQQDVFIQNFRRMVENSSVKKLEVYKSDSTQYEPTVIKKDEAKLTANVWYKGKKSVLVYKFDLVDGAWRSWDLVIDDLSTARNYREQFSKILKTKSFDELLEIVRKKADEDVQ